MSYGIAVSKYDYSFLAYWYCIMISCVVLLAWYCATSDASFWSILVSLLFMAINFFAMYTDGSNWYYQVPVFTASMIYTIVLNYEAKYLATVLDFVTMYRDYENQWHISWSISLYASFYYRMARLEKKRINDMRGNVN
jgi:hypothetical protein